MCAVRCFSVAVMVMRVALQLAGLTRSREGKRSGVREVTGGLPAAHPGTALSSSPGGDFRSSGFPARDLLPARFFARRMIADGGGQRRAADGSLRVGDLGRGGVFSITITITITSTSTSTTFFCTVDECEWRLIWGLGG